MTTKKKPSANRAASPEITGKKTKVALLVELLQRAGGSTLAELSTETGWQPHTVRAALTGLRKKGYNLIRAKRDDVTCYTIVAAQA